MQTSAKEQEKLLQQIAVRQVLRGKGSAFFHLLFPFSIFVGFSVFYITPWILVTMLDLQSDWLITYFFWSTPVCVIATLSLHGYLRHRRLKPVINSLREKLDHGEQLQ